MVVNVPKCPTVVGQLNKRLYMQMMAAQSQPFKNHVFEDCKDIENAAIMLSN